MYPKARLDALSDAIFGVSMTLLVLDVRLPDDVHPRDIPELLRALLDLLPKFLPYVLSFLVLGLRWLSNIHVRTTAETVSMKYARWWLTYHLLVTCIPFATIVVGRFPDLAPAVWLYAGITLIMSAVAFRMLSLTPAVERADHLRDRQVSIILMIGLAVLAIAWSFVSPRQALWVFVLNLAARPISRRIGGAG
jgi:uncharacterized membrane protein